MNVDDWPSHAEELGRKTLAQLQRWVEKYEAGKITARELYIVADTLYETTVGLAPMEDVDLVVQVHTEIKNLVRR